MSPSREADRLRVIIESIAFTDPDMKMADAAPVIFEIEKRTLKLESAALAPSVTVTLPDTTPETGALFIDLQPHIKDNIPGKKINAIKDFRAITTWGLKESKDAVEYWASTRARPIPAATPFPATGVSSAPPWTGGIYPSKTDIANFIDTQPDIISTLKSGTGTGHSSSPKIHAIKEVRIRMSIGLREAKEGVEEWIDRTPGVS